MPRFLACRWVRRAPPGRQRPLNTARPADASRGKSFALAEAVSLADIRRALLAYVAVHPRASDTITGIAGFWLANALDGSIQDLERVVAELVAEGVLTTATLSDGSQLYSVGPAATS